MSYYTQAFYEPCQICWPTQRFETVKICKGHPIPSTDVAADLAKWKAVSSRLWRELESNLRCSEGCYCEARAALRAYRELEGK